MGFQGGSLLLRQRSKTGLQQIPQGVRLAPPGSPGCKITSKIEAKHTPTPTVASEPRFYFNRPVRLVCFSFIAVAGGCDLTACWWKCSESCRPAGLSSVGSRACLINAFHSMMSALGTEQVLLVRFFPRYQVPGTCFEHRLSPGTTQYSSIRSSTSYLQQTAFDTFQLEQSLLNDLVFQRRPHGFHLTSVQDAAAGRYCTTLVHPTCRTPSCAFWASMVNENWSCLFYLAVIGVRGLASTRGSGGPQYVWIGDVWRTSVIKRHKPYSSVSLMSRLALRLNRLLGPKIS